MHPKTLQLLAHLRENSREKLTTISKKTNIPISTLFDMLKEMQDNLITKSTVLIDFSKLGYHTKAKVFLKVKNGDKDKLKKHLMFNPNINSIYKINNGWNFLIESVHKNNKELNEFIESLENNFQIEKHEIHYLIDEVKREGFKLN